MDRRSAPCSIKCVAKLCRSMCGVRGFSRPRRFAQLRMRSQSVTAAKGVPRALKKTVAGERAVKRAGRPVSRYRSRALRAVRPTGTIRSLFPLPMTVTSPASRCRCSSRMDRSSASRSPPAYASSRIAWSRSSAAPADLSGGIRSFVISASLNAFGSRFHRRGNDRFSAGFRFTHFSVSQNRKKARSAEICR